MDGKPRCLRFWSIDIRWGWNYQPRLGQVNDLHLRLKLYICNSTIRPKLKWILKMSFNLRNSNIGLGLRDIKPEINKLLTLQAKLWANFKIQVVDSS